VVNAILESSYTKTEIIIVNDCSTDGSGDVIDSISQRFTPGKVKALHLPSNTGKRRAIREGIIQGKAAGEILVFIDSDCIVESKAIERLVIAFDDQQIGAVAGHGKVLRPDASTLAKLQETWYDGQFSVMKGMESAFGTVTCCPAYLLLTGGML
jgi:glycosyltransferase involved in cell wall biosynthesis